MMDELKKCYYCGALPEIKATKKRVGVQCSCGRTLMDSREYAADTFLNWNLINMMPDELLEYASMSAIRCIKLNQEYVSVWREAAQSAKKAEATK